MAEQAASAGRFLRSTFSSPMVWAWIAVWILTRILMVVQIGHWNNVVGVNYQDVEFYKNWANTLIVYDTMPSEPSWQYPPGAAFFLIAPYIGIELFGAAYQPSFLGLILLVDLAGLALMIWLARSTGRNLGVWVWLIAIPLLGANPITRFDLAPTVLTMAALVLIHRRPGWFGAAVGAGTSIKLWPVVALLGEWDRRRLAISAAAAAVVIALTFVVAWIFFGDQSEFFGNQDVRGLHREAVAAIPWYAEWTVTGVEPPIALRNGTAEIGTPTADDVAVLLKWLGLLVLLAAALWWVARDRAIRRGRTDLADAALGRDFVFTIVLLQIVVSRVLSPQFMIWLIGLAAVLLSAGPTRLTRPIWIALAAVALSTGIYFLPVNLLVRNGALLVAAIDAALIMYKVLRDPAEGSTAAAVTEKDERRVPAPMSIASPAATGLREG